MRKTYRSLLAASFCLLLLFVTACGSSGSGNTPAAAKDSTGSAGAEKAIYIGMVNPPVTLNPINLTDAASIFVSGFIFDTLLALTEDFGFLPKLAESVESADSQTYTVKLNPNAKWSDGEPFTTKDVEFTLNLVANPLVESMLRLKFIEGLNDAGKLDEGQTAISGLKIIDEHTFEIKTKTPVDPNYFNDNFSTRFRFLPAHVLSGVAPADLATNAYMQNPSVTLGAFTFSKFAKDQYVEVSANPDYYQGAPKVNKVYMKIMPASNLVAQLQTGEIQMNSMPIGLIPIQDFEKVKNMTNVTVESGLPTEPTLLVYNTKVFKDAKTRQAIAYSINRDLIVKQLLKGEGEIIDGLLTSIHPYYKEEASYAYDPEKAKQLLEEAGWDFNQVITFNVPVGNKVREQAADIMTENMKAVGLKVQVQKYDFPTLIQKALSHDFDLTMFTNTFSLDPGVTFQILDSTNAYNMAQYSDAEMDALIAKGAAEADPEKRRVIYDEIQDQFHEELPMLTIYSEKRLQAVSKNVLVGKPIDIGPLNNVNEWDLTE